MLFNVGWWVIFGVFWWFDVIVLVVMVVYVMVIVSDKVLCLNWIMLSFFVFYEFKRLNDWGFILDVKIFKKLK